jgi:hypothetical protein
MATTAPGLPKEHGFWDYTTPCAGGMEGYGRDDYEALLDDMAEAGMGSVLVMPKWLTTGYRSRLAFLDQHGDNPVTRSDNRLLADFLDGAAARGISTWLGAVVSMYPLRSVRSEPSMTFSGEFGGFPLSEPTGVYDADAPEVREFAPAVFGELRELFPGVGGFMVELELCDIASPHRIGLYDAWARQRGRPPYAELARPMASRWLDISPWREYVTESRVTVLQAIETTLRSGGFTGRISTLCETGAIPYQVQQSVDLQLLARRCPGIVVVSYDANYEKSRNRWGLMEMAVDEPRRAGLECQYLARGVMTWAGSWPLPTSLEGFWALEREDVELFRPDGLWWFGSGSGAIPEGAHVSVRRLRQSGYEDGRAARRALLRSLRRSP